MISRNIQGLYDALFDTLDGLMDSSVAPNLANSRFKGINTVINLGKFQMQAHKFITDNGGLPAISFNGDKPQEIEQKTQGNGNGKNKKSM